MFAERILAVVRTCSALQAGLLTFPARALPTAGSVGRTVRFHLAKSVRIEADSSYFPYQH